MQRNRIIATDGGQCSDRRPSVDEIILAVHFEPADGGPLGTNARHVRGTQANPRRNGKRSRGGHGIEIRRKKYAGDLMPAQSRKVLAQDFGAIVLPPTFSHVPLATYFHDTGSLSTVLCPAQACFPAAQSFCPALATPKHLSLLASGVTGAADTEAARPSASRPATGA